MLDTNAVSETVKPRPNLGLLRWHDAQDPACLFVTSVTLAEIWNGFFRLPANHPDFHRIKRFATELAREYRLLSFDKRAAKVWGEMVASPSGPLPLRDSLIGAIALARGYSVVTRDQAVFKRIGCKVVNPWT